MFWLIPFSNCGIHFANVIFILHLYVALSKLNVFHDGVEYDVLQKVKKFGHPQEELIFR